MKVPQDRFDAQQPFEILCVCHMTRPEGSPFTKYTIHSILKMNLSYVHSGLK